MSRSQNVTERVERLLSLLENVNRRGKVMRSVKGLRATTCSTRWVRAECLDRAKQLVLKKASE